MTVIISAFLQKEIKLCKNIHFFPQIEPFSEKNPQIYNFSF